MSAVRDRVDAHHHVWDLRRREQPWIDPIQMEAINRSFTVDELSNDCDRAGVTATILVQVLNRSDETHELLHLAATTPLIAGVVGWVDLRSPDLADQLDELSQAGPLAGIRHQLLAEPDPTQWLALPEVHVGLRALERASLPFDLIIRPKHAAAAQAVVRAHPGLQFVLNHLGKPDIAAGQSEPWSVAMSSLAAEPNVTCKLSGLVTVADHTAWTLADLSPYVDAALERFGPDRLMFGSDWPVCLLAARYPQVIGAVEESTTVLSETEQEALWSTTARRVYAVPT